MTHPHFTKARLLLAPALLSLMAACGDNAPEPISEPEADAASSMVVLAQPDMDESTPLPVKVVIVTMFEIGEDSGDQAGEFQLWNERLDLDTVLPNPGGHHAYHYNPETQILGMVTGIGTAKSTAAIMGLGHDDRFDVSKAYWLVAGIAGIDPEDASIGSAAWATYLVDGDLAHEIDPREIPEDWETGYFARYTTGPNDPNRPEPTGELFIANTALRDWAFELTKDIELPDDPQIAEERASFTEHPMAQKPPFVLKGAQLAAMTFWHGEMMNDWANDWVAYWTDGEGDFVTSAMEDTGTFQALTYLDGAGLVDKDRGMVLRAGSNYTMPPPGVTAVDYLLRENEEYSGLNAALESLYLVGSTVIDELIENWDVYGDTVPGSDAAE
ncbi:putative purine nucleoside permease [Parvularcula bermudensis HTCC2503]|uniref:Putative purine nucleoside permease n=1 Tax=Parvularcula bermudensis (strain ATCC BAA-594 / HTCC2503 / KCTC 12087) TaxID=314260 RepID=E0TCX2_PARBH|nr:purine nucleoside permease [Parvularcula bermudensis]ADM10355.1 putative purine nucleoside permease [Parvularcula bermudensis HTCC2503]